MAIFGDKKFEPTPIYLKDTVSCNKCKCLLLETWAHKVNNLYFYENNYGSRISDVVSFCQGCKPPYDERHIFFSGFPTANMDKPSQIKYFKKLTLTKPFYEVTEEGEKIDGN